MELYLHVLSTAQACGITSSTALGLRETIIGLLLSSDTVTRNTFSAY